MENDIREIMLDLPHVCASLTTLSLQRNECLSQITDPFFVQMSGLRVLDLSYTAMITLPRSVSNLESLSAFLLRGCDKLILVPPLDRLKNLIELDLYNTIIEEVPQGLERLVNLRFLDMRRDTEAPLKKPAGDILSRLSNLQSLSIPFGIRLEDLQGMKQLKVFSGEFVDVPSFTRFVTYRQSFGIPSFFALVLDPENSFTFNLDGFIPYRVTFSGKFVILKHLVFTEDNAEMLWYDEIERGQNVSLLPLDTQALLIEECKFCNSCNSLLDAIPYLIQSKDLIDIRIRQCNDIEFLIRLSNCNSGHHSRAFTCNPFQCLDRLFLDSLDEFTGLVKLEIEALLPFGTFSYLKFIYVSECNKMKKLFPTWLLQYLVNLKAITVRVCKEMEDRITEDEEAQANQCTSSASLSSIAPSDQSRSIKHDEIVLPNLVCLRLFELPQLRSIYKGRMNCGSIQIIGVRGCPKLKRLPFTLPVFNSQP